MLGRGKIITAVSVAPLNSHKIKIGDRNMNNQQTTKDAQTKVSTANNGYTDITVVYTEIFEDEGGKKKLRLRYPDGCGQAMYDCFLKNPVEMQKLLENWISCWRK